MPTETCNRPRATEKKKFESRRVSLLFDTSPSEGAGTLRTAAVASTRAPLAHAERARGTSHVRANSRPPPIITAVEGALGEREQKKKKLPFFAGRGRSPLVRTG